MRTVGGVVNMAVVMAAAEGIIAAQDQSLPVQHGGHIEIKKSWAKSLLGRMGYVKRKCFNAGKISLPHFKQIQENFLADIQAKVVMNEGSNSTPSRVNRSVDDASRRKKRRFLSQIVTISVKLQLFSLLP